MNFAMDSPCHFTQSCSPRLQNAHSAAARTALHELSGQELENERDDLEHFIIRGVCVENMPMPLALQCAGHVCMSLQRHTK